MNSITKRWVRGSLFFTLVVVLVAEIVFLWSTITGYYNSVRVSIDNQLTSLNAQLSFAANSSAEDKAVRLRRLVEDFSEKPRFELMLVNADGVIVMTSSGLMPDQSGAASDIEDALQSGGRKGEFIGEVPGGERVMAVTQRTPYVSDDIVALRLVTSLTLVERAILNAVLYSLVFLLLLVLASVFSGVYFIRSIVIPLRKVEATAARIAEGDFETRIETQNMKSNDEIGKLCETINHMAEELQRTEEMKNDFISSVSHELRTPLTSIKGWTETVGRMSGPEDESFRRGVDIIAGETDRLYDMVEELLDFSRMQHGLTLKPELLDLAAEVEEAVLIAERRAHSLGLVLVFDVPELPVPVMADKNRIRQVLLNVLDNAVKYSFPGGCIRLDILQDAGSAFVVVTDQGQGIPPEDLEHVKVRFYKGKGAVRGSGIGLAVVNEIMQAHGGALNIASEVGAGTEVTLRFPLFRKEDAQPPEATKPAPLKGAKKE